MKILQVIPCFSPPELFGGSQTVAYNISKFLVKIGHEVVVYTSDMKNTYSRLKSGVEEVDGIEIHHFRNVSTIVSKVGRLLITPDMNSIIKKEIQTFDVAHLHEFRNFQHFVVHHYARKENVPYVVQTHGTLSWPGTFQRLKRLYDLILGDKLLRDASRVIASSRVEVEQFRKRGITEEKIEVINNGIDLADFDRLPPRGAFRKEYGISEDTKLILYLGRVDKVKGIDFLIKAFCQLKKQMNNVKLVIAGPDDGYLNMCVRLVNALGIDQSVLFTGPLYGREKLEIYNDVDVYVLPSLYETFSLTVLEAYACSKPVIATRVGALRDNVIHGKTGLLVEPNESGELSNAMLQLLTDRKFAEDMGRNARWLVLQEFSLEKVAHRLEKLYERIA